MLSQVATVICTSVALSDYVYFTKIYSELLLSTTNTEYLLCHLQVDHLLK